MLLVSEPNLAKGTRECENCNKTDNFVFKCSSLMNAYRIVHPYPTPQMKPLPFPLKIYLQYIDPYQFITKLQDAVF